MKSIIFGSGYGIYVYLPAIYKFSKIIYLNKKYQYNFNKRKNIRKLNDKIIWYNQTHKIISKIDHIFIAKRPKDQLKIINKLEFNKLKIKRLFLEKPISNNPLNSLKLIKYLESKKINFNVGFLFKFTDWYNIFKKNNKVGGKYKILWKIKINKKNKSWKYNTKDGGGLLRFYGIHLLRFLFDNKFINIKKKIIKKNLFSIISKDNKNNFIEIVASFSNKNKFLVKNNNCIMYESLNPFLKKIKKYDDPRIGFVSKYIKDALKGNKTNYKYEKDFILFWKKIEKNDKTKI